MLYANVPNSVVMLRSAVMTDLFISIEFIDPVDSAAVRGSLRLK